MKTPGHRMEFMRRNFALDGQKDRALQTKLTYSFCF
jgi:hypothetical protein